MAQQRGRGMLKGMAVLAALVVAGALGLGRGSASAEDLRIGIVAPMTGIFAQIGADMVNGMQMYLDEVNSDFAGAKVTMIVEDTQGKPPINVQKAQKLVRQDKVHMFIGGLLASSGYALAPVSTRSKVLYIMPVAAADDLTQRQEYPYLLRTGWTSSMPSHPFGEWACDKGYKRIAAIGADYAFGYEVIGGFQKSFEDCGGKIVQKIWPPIGTKDFGPYIPTIKSDIDAIFTLMVGPMSLQFPKQLRAAGIKKPVLGGGTSYDEFILPSMGDEVIGHVSGFMYSAALDTPKNAAFVKKYRAKYGKVPSYYSEANYTTAQWIDDTIRKAKGKYPGPLEFIKMMRGIKVDAVRGPVELDDRNTAINNIYIKKVERKKMFGYDKAELWNTVIKTYPRVSQFWTYDKAAFLKQPLYSRDFPPCKYCD